MADKAIGDLPQASVINSNDLFLLEQGGEAKSLPGSRLTLFIDRHIVSVNVNIVPSTQQGGGSYNAQTGELTLNIPKGNGVVGISKTGSSGNVDTYRLTYEDGTYNTFSVTNGSNIQSIAKTATAGLVDTYTVTLTDGSTTTFQVQNGADGQGTVNSVMGISPDANLDIPEASVKAKLRLLFDGKTVATSAWTNNTPYDDFPYYADILCSGVTLDDVADVYFSGADVTSGIYAPFCATLTNYVRIYAAEIPDSAIEIPRIRIER